eukprot:3430044-Rhodomonas_salina.2
MRQAAAVTRGCLREGRGRVLETCGALLEHLLAQRVRPPLRQWRLRDQPAPVATPSHRTLPPMRQPSVSTAPEGCRASAKQWLALVLQQRRVARP